MRVGLRSLGDFVNGKFAVPQTPVVLGMGDFVGAKFALPQNPVGLGFVGARFSLPENPVGLGDCGCGCGGGCQGGMGDIDFSLEGTGIGDSVGMSGVPNWLIYITAAGAGTLIYMETQKKGRRR